MTPAVARAALARRGFGGRYWYQPSWTVRKGMVIELWPTGGTRLRRPARVTIVVASGYPRSVVPDLLRTDSASAQTQLRAKHLQFRIVYRLAPPTLANQVLAQTPAAGHSVLQGTRVELTVARTLHWVTILARSGSGGYLSPAFTAPNRCRIRYRLGVGDLGFALAQIGWSPDGALFGTSGFTAHDSNRLDTQVVATPGTYRLSISPYLGTTWRVEVDALE